MTTTIGLWVRWNRSAEKHKGQGARDTATRRAKNTPLFINGRALTSSSVELLTYQPKNR
jgi:hypothetical protein